MLLVLCLALVIVLAVNTEAGEYDLPYSELRERYNELGEALKSESYPDTLKALRNLVNAFPKENVKMVGIDIKSWSVRIGTATYLHGDFSDITFTPFWVDVKNYAHILHNPGEHIHGIGYISGDLHMTKESAKLGFRTAVVPDVATKVYAFGSGNIDTTKAMATETTCQNLHDQWNNMLREYGPHFDNKTFVTLTDDLYCPTELQKLAGSYYRDVSLTKGYANDGTPVDIISTFAEAIKREHEEAKEEQQPEFDENNIMAALLKEDAEKRMKGLVGTPKPEQRGTTTTNQIPTAKPKLVTVQTASIPKPREDF